MDFQLRQLNTTLTLIALKAENRSSQQRLSHLNVVELVDLAVQHERLADDCFNGLVLGEELRDVAVDFRLWLTTVRPVIVIIVW